MIDIDSIENIVVDRCVKGFPPTSNAMKLREIGLQKWNIMQRDTSFPVATISEEALHNNQRWMNEFLGKTGVKLAPHGKTTMAPQLLKMQIEANCWGITVATVQQLAVCREYGFDRILMANQLTSSHAVTYVMNELHSDPNFQFYCLLDSIEGLERLARQCQDKKGSRPIEVLLEIGFDGGRTGFRDADEAIRAARFIARNDIGLAVAGIETYEGLLVSDEADVDEQSVRQLLDRLVAVAAQCSTEGLFTRTPAILSAGGSAYYDMVADQLASLVGSDQFEIIVRSGCYLTHDSAFYARLFDRITRRVPNLHGIDGELIPALTVWSEVQSRPEPNLAILTMGRRDVSFDSGLPTPKWHLSDSTNALSPIENIEIFQLNDQHAYMHLPDNLNIQVGDIIGCGISHPCTTFDKWKMLYVVDNEWTIKNAIMTFF